MSEKQKRINDYLDELEAKLEYISDQMDDMKTRNSEINSFMNALNARSKSTQELIDHSKQLIKKNSKCIRNSR